MPDRFRLIPIPPKKISQKNYMTMKIILILVMLVIPVQAFAFWPQLLIGAAEAIGTSLALEEAEKIVTDAWNKYHAPSIPNVTPTGKKVAYKVRNQAQANWLTAKYGPGIWSTVGAIVLVYTFQQATLDMLDTVVKDVRTLTGLAYSTGSFSKPTTLVGGGVTNPVTPVSTSADVAWTSPYTVTSEPYFSMTIPEQMLLFQAQYDAVSANLQAAGFEISGVTFRSDDLPAIDRVLWQGIVLPGNYELGQMSFLATIKDLSSLELRVQIYGYIDNIDGIYFSIFVDQITGRGMQYIVGDRIKTINFVVHSDDQYWQSYLNGNAVVSWKRGIPILDAAHSDYPRVLTYVDPSVTQTDGIIWVEPTLGLEWTITAESYYGADVVAYVAVTDPTVLSTVGEEDIFAGNILDPAPYDKVVDLPDSAINTLDATYPITDGSGGVAVSAPPTTQQVEQALDNLLANQSYPAITPVSYDTTIDPEQKKGTIYSVMATFVSNSPWGVALRGSGLQVSSEVCSFSTMLFNKNITIDFCTIDQFYSVFRPLIVLVFSLTAMFIIFA